jgi:hypothetical protein
MKENNGPHGFRRTTDATITLPVRVTDVNQRIFPFPFLTRCSARRDREPDQPCATERTW